MSHQYTCAIEWTKQIKYSLPKLLTLFQVGTTWESMLFINNYAAPSLSYLHKNEGGSGRTRMNLTILATLIEKAYRLHSNVM